MIPTGFIAQKSAPRRKKIFIKTTIESVRISIIPRLGLRVAGLQIGAPKTDDFFVSSIRFLSKWIGCLCSKQVKVSEISINKPLIEMYAVENPPAAEEKTKTETSSEPAGVELNIQSLTVSDATFTMFDANMKPTVHVAGLSEKLSFDYSANGTSTIDGDTIIPTLAVMTPMGELGRNTRIEIRKKFQVDPKNLAIQEFKIKLGSLPISLEGTVKDYSSENPDVDLKFSGGPADIDNIVGLVPSSMLPPDLKSVDSNGNLNITGNLQGKINTAKAAESIQSSNFAINMTLTNGSIKAPQLPKPMTNIGFAVSVNPKKAEVKNFTTDFGSSTIRFSALVSDYLKNPVFDFQTKSNLSMEDVSALRSDLPVKNLKGSIAADIQASGATKNPLSTVLNGLVTMKDLSLEYPEMKYNIESFNSNLKLAQNNVVIQNLSLLINGSDISGSGRIDNPMAMMNNDKKSLMKFSLTAASKNLDADKLMPPPSDEESSLPPSFFKLDGDIKATIAKLIFNKLEMTQAVGNIGVHKGLITFDPLSVKTFGGTLALNGNVNLQSRKHPTFDLDTNINNIAVDKALAYADNISKLLKLDNSVKANVSLKAKAQGELTKNFDLNMSKLNSSGNFSLSDAVIQNHPIQQAFAKYFKSDQFDKLSVSKWTQAFAVNEGKLNVKDLNFGAKDFAFNINGWQSLEGKNNFSIDAKLPTSLTSKITDKLPAPVAALMGNQKQLTLPFLVSGETNNPSLGLNDDKLAGNTKDQVKDQVKAETNKLTQDLKSDAKSSLKGLVGGKTDDKKTAKTPAPKKEDVKKEVKDVKNKLKKLF
ncbi:MAG: AsmA-like C-terminal region-containing protein [Bdellovibrionota bacterium]